MDREIELKLECEPDALDLVRRSPALSKLKQGRARKRALHSVYFDTEDFALLKHGIALRVREADGKRIQTLKTARDGRSAANERHEYETPLAHDAEKPDLNRLPSGLRAKIRKLAGKATIAPRVVTDIERIASQLRTASGDEIELALDSGVLRANGRTRAISEVELELKQGNPASLYELALKLADSAPLRVRLASKSEQGLALARNRESEVTKADVPELSPETTIEEAFALILRQCLFHLIANENPTLERRSAEGLHQMRVAIRRLLSALALFKRLAADSEARFITAEAKWLGGCLGRARDFDVFLSTLEHVDEKPRSQKLRRAARLAHEETWAAALAAIHSKRYTYFVLRLARYIAASGWRSEKITRAWERPLQHFSSTALDRFLAKVVDLGAHIEKLEVEERHTLRKRLKKLRYSVSFFASLYREGDAKHYLHDLSQLQDLFGSLNDAAVAGMILQRLTSVDPSLQKPSARLMAALERRVQKDWVDVQHVWRKFRADEPFWR